MSRQQSGFTIIELVVVIILLGILAATALPRFMSVDNEAHDAVVSAVQGSLQTGISLYHAQWTAQGKPDPDTQIAAFGNLRVNAAGFPYGAEPNTDSDIGSSADCLAIYQGILQVGGRPTIESATDLAGVAAAAGSDPRFDFVAVEDSGNCVYHYTAQTVQADAEIATLIYNSEAGTIVRGTATIPPA